MNNIKELLFIFVIVLITLIIVLIMEIILLPYNIKEFIKKVYGKISKRIRR
jgi:hypothetical protein